MKRFYLALPILAVSAGVARADGTHAASLDETNAAPLSWSLELGAGAGASRDDGFTDRLADFGYNQGAPLKGQLSFTLERVIGEHARVIGELAYLDGNRYVRDRDGASRFVYKWQTYGAMVGSRFAIDSRSWLEEFVELKAGATVGRSALTQDDVMTTRNTDLGFVLSAAIGSHMMPWRRFGFSWRFGYQVAPTLTNELGDTHDSGGLFGSVAARFRF